jgi:glyoxylase-like metal-dependent hydrolase (beta-lactamase superfamily II)
MRFFSFHISLLALSCAVTGCYFRQLERSTGIVDRNDLPLKVTHVAGHLYLVEDFNFRKTNSVFYAHPEGIYFFDATWQPKTADQVIWKGAVYSMADFAGVIATSFDISRTGGLSAFRGRDISIYMHKNSPGLLNKHWQSLNKRMLRDFSSWQEPLSLKPDFIIDDEAALLNGRIKLYHPGPAFSPDNLVVFFEEEKILFGGALIAEEQEYAPLATSSKAYRKAIFRVKNRFAPEKIIAGNGRALYGKELLDNLFEKYRYQEPLLAPALD